MKQKSHLFGYILLIVGLVLISEGFFVFVSEEKRNEVFWLNLIAVCFIFLVTSLTELSLFGFNFDFEKGIAGLGIRLIYIRFYSVVAIGTIIVGYFAEIKFNYQLFFQLLAAFILFVGYFFSNLSSIKAISVKAEQDYQRKGKDEILRVIGQFEILITTNSTKFWAEKQKIENLKETVRYLSPSNNQTAIDLDSEIVATIKQAHTIAKNSENVTAQVFILLNRCEDLLKLRKNTNSN